MTATSTADRVSDRIIFTQAAAAKVAELMAAETDPGLHLRVFARGGGCDGFEYGFEFDDTAGSNDLTVTKNGVSLLVDALSYQNLIGAKIDYQDSDGFLIDNPNAAAGSCGCEGACGTA